MEHIKLAEVSAAEQEKVSYGTGGASLELEPAGFLRVLIVDDQRTMRQVRHFV